MTDGEELGDWWEDISSAPEDERVLVAIPPVDRPRKEGEKKEGSWQDRKKDRIRRPAAVTTGILLNGTWAPGRRSRKPFMDDPTHWMRLPDLPDEYLG